jgi:hypothetical protein
MLIDEILGQKPAMLLIKMIFLLSSDNSEASCHRYVTMT